ncbi:MAG: glycosyltransferase [Anaerolineales bacterium]|jgi:glycosyltransferase involved in cell wall biosynthesis
MQSVKALLRERVKNILRTASGKPQKGPPARLFGFKEFCTSPPTQKALVSYLVSPLLPAPEKRDKMVFSNLGMAQYIPRALNELGYEVDVVPWDDMEWLPQQHYDIYVGHGGINFEHISRSLPKETVRIYFSTGIYWREFNIREARRIYNLALRRGYLLTPDRAIQFSEEYANQTAEGIICLGNQNAIESYRQFPLVIGINNAVYHIDFNGLADKDFDRGRQHFLFFSGGGNIHKGLDLLLEAFAGTDLHLHICQTIDPAFAKIYKDELTQHTNIHIYGTIPMRSPSYEALAMQCNWVISATCAEGQPGATLECMGYGLIPVLSTSDNIDLEDFGIFLPLNNVADIRKVILRAAKMDVDDCEQRAILTAAAIREKYSPEKFNNNFKNAVQKIVSQKQTVP